MLNDLKGMDSVRRIHLNEELANTRKLVLEAAGGNFKIDELAKLRNIFITEDFMNEKVLADGKYDFIWGNQYSINRSDMNTIQWYIKLYTLLNFNAGHSLFVNHITGFMVIDTNNLKYNSELCINTNPEDIGHLIGKGGAHIIQLRNEINRTLKELNVKDNVKFIAAHKIQSYK